MSLRRTSAKRALWEPASTRRASPSAAIVYREGSRTQPIIQSAQRSSGTRSTVLGQCFLRGLSHGKERGNVWAQPSLRHRDAHRCEKGTFANVTGLIHSSRCSQCPASRVNTRKGKDARAAAKPVTRVRFCSAGLIQRINFVPRVDTCRVLKEVRPEKNETTCLLQPKAPPLAPRVQLEKHKRRRDKRPVMHASRDFRPQIMALCAAFHASRGSFLSAAKSVRIVLEDFSPNLKLPESVKHVLLVLLRARVAENVL